jgi:protein TonB
MKRTFLIGRFLQSHSGVYRHTPPISGEGTHLSQDVLQKRFQERANRFRAERHRYVLHLQACVAAAVMLAIGAFSLDLKPRESASLTLATQEVVTLQEIIQTRQQLKPPPPPRPPIPVEVPNDVILEDDDLPLGDPLELVVLRLPPPPLPDAEPEEEEDELFVIVEQRPAIIGGQAALFAALEYPIVAQRAGIEGMVVVLVTVEPDGNPSDPEVLRSAHEILDKTAVEAVLKQQFTPGRQRGRAVRVRMAIPVKFTLRNS